MQAAAGAHAAAVGVLLQGAVEGAGAAVHPDLERLQHRRVRAAAAAARPRRLLHRLQRRAGGRPRPASSGAVARRTLTALAATLCTKGSQLIKELTREPGDSQGNAPPPLDPQMIGVLTESRG